MDEQEIRRRLSAKEDLPPPLPPKRAKLPLSKSVSGGGCPMFADGPVSTIELVMRWSLALIMVVMILVGFGIGIYGYLKRR